jgi:hypothetical protein
VEEELKEADVQFEEEEGKDAATEAVFASRDQDMKDLDTNADGVLDTKEVANEIDEDMKEADEVSMLQQMKDEVSTEYQVKQLEVHAFTDLCLPLFTLESYPQDPSAQASRAHL